jgi:hypothetical protein
MLFMKKIRSTFSGSFDASTKFTSVGKSANNTFSYVCPVTLTLLNGNYFKLFVNKVFTLLKVLGPTIFIDRKSVV